MAKKKNDGYMIDGQIISSKQMEEYSKAIDKATKSLEQFVSSNKELNKAQQENVKIRQKLIEGNEKISKEWKRQQQESYTKLGDNFAIDTDRLINKVNSKKTKQMPKTIAEWYNLSSSNAQKTYANNITREISEKYYNQYSKGGKKAVTGKALEEMNRKIEEEAAEKIGESADKFGRFSGVMQVVSDTFSAAVQEFNKIVKTAINTTYDTNTNTLNRIVSSNYFATKGGNLTWSSGNFSAFGSTYSGFSEINNAVTDQLDADGLTNNVSNSKILKGIAELTTKQGMGLEAAIAKAYQDTTIKYIVPYLNTTSEVFTGMEMRMPGLSKNIAATAISVREQLGESQYLSSHINDLVNLMEPVSLQANKELYSEQFSQIAATLESYVASGKMTAAEAQNYANEAFQMYMDPTGTMKNGSTVAKMTTSGAISTGNIDNPAYYVDALLKNVDTVLDWGGGDSIAENIIGANMTGKASTFRTFNNEKDVNRIAESKETKEEMKKFDQMIKGADNMNTTQQQIETYVENITTILGDIKTAMGSSLWELGKVVISGIVGGLAAGQIGKGISALAGLNGAKLSGGLGKLIASGGGGAALGTIGGVAAATALIAAVNYGVQEANKGSKQHGDTTGEKAVEGTQFQGNNAVQDLISGAATIADRGWLQNSWNNMTSGIGYFGSKLFQGKADNNKNLTQWIMSSDTLGKDEATIATRLAVWGLMLNQAGYWEEFKAGMRESGAGGSWTDATPEELAELLRTNKWTKEGVNNIAASLISAGYKPYLSDGSRMKSFDFNPALVGLDGVEGFRYGLAEVPYDNYLASLHEGEAVLTASTANELRGLLDEYRNTNNQAVSFDAIIQTQTTALVTKLDEVISTIKTSGVGGVVTGTSTQANAVQKLNHSMLHMTSTKQL